MLFLKRTALVTLASFMFSSGALGCNGRQPANSQTDTPAPVNEKEQSKPGELKVLAEGSQSAITDPFIAVVRDGDTYAELVKLDGNLPKLDADFFETKVVVAAFLGERNTGGYSVEIGRDASGLRVMEKKPGKDMMVTQVITAPFKIVSVEGVSNSRMSLTLDDAWQTRMTPFRVNTGKFTMVGGIAGAREEFDLGGTIGVLRAANLATFHFRLIAPATTKRRALTECATGIVSSYNNIRISRMGADSLINPPSPGLQANGTLSDGGKKLQLNLSSRPSMIADGYSGRGSIEATVAVAAKNP